MILNNTRYRRKICVFCSILTAVLIALCFRLFYLMIVKGDYYSKKASALQERERDIAGIRGDIVDRNERIIATNETAYNISVIHNQITDKEAVISVLSSELSIDEKTIRSKVDKVTSIEKIKNNVSKKTGDKILSYGLAGVKVDESSVRYYPLNELFSKVIGFAGADGQGVVGLETTYDEILRGTPGRIYTVCDGRGVEVKGYKERREAPQKGDTLVTTLDINIQRVCEKNAMMAYAQNLADSVSIIALNPKNGEIYAMTDYPEYNLNDPFSCENHDEAWRNGCVSDTYEPGSVFKIITAGIALEEDVVSLDDRFYCPGYITVEDRRIHCHKRTGHGSETFVQGIQNSCNPVFIDLGLRIGSERYYAVMTTVSSLINGGNRITPHIGKEIHSTEGTVKEVLSFEQTSGICSEETSDTLRKLLEGVVAEGSGKNAKVEGYAIGGKTATSQTLPRSDNVYIASFLGFYPVDDPALMVLVKINNPKGGAYYGGTIAAPVAAEIFREIIPYAQEIGVCN